MNDIITDENTLATLSQCPLFKGMQQLDIIKLLEQSAFHITRLKRGQTLANAGDACTHADIIIKGTLTPRMVGESGKFVEVTTLRPGNLVAPAFIFARDNAFPVEVVADNDVELLRQTQRDFKKWLDCCDDLRWNFIALLSNTNAFLTRKIHTLSLLTVREKLASLLLEASRRQQSRTITLDKSRQEIADMFGIQKYSVTRQLAIFQKEGAISINGKQITLSQPQLLKSQG